MKDIVWNASVLGLGVPEQEVQAFLEGSERRFLTGTDLLRAVAVRFSLDEAVLAREVERFRHCNCAGSNDDSVAAAQGGKSDEVSEFARNVTLHVVLHELGHALVREFDIPVLGNEETVADAFATYYLTTCMPDRAVDVLVARTTSLMLEAGEASQPVDWSGEHDHDARRANQIAALAVAADPVKYRPVAEIVGMSDEQIESACDYGGEIRRSWRRVLQPLWMPEGVASDEARVVHDEKNAFLNQLCGGGLAGEIEWAISRFDWHSQVTVRFAAGEGGAAWSRSGRTITVHEAYVRRFVEQGGRTELLSK